MVLTPAKVGRPVEALKVHTCSLCLQISTSTCRACSQRLPPRTRSATGQLLRSFHRFPHLPQPLSRLSVWPLPWPQWLPRKGQSPRHPTDQPPPRSVGAPRRRPPQQRRWLGGVSWPWEEKGQRVGREPWGGRVGGSCVPRLRMPPPSPQGSGQTVQVPPGDEKG